MILQILPLPNKLLRCAKNRCIIPKYTDFSYAFQGFVSFAYQEVSLRVIEVDTVRVCALHFPCKK